VANAPYGDVITHNMKTKQLNFIALLHSLGVTEKIRVDFKSDKPASDFYEHLKLDGYKIYQYIQDDYQYNMEPSELESNRVKFKLLQREKKIWFGLSKKMVSDLLIYPKNGFYYPYQYGHYFYLYSKHAVNELEFENWLNTQFPNRFVDFDVTHAGLNTKSIQLLNDNDYLIVTNHDCQEEFGITGSTNINQQILKKLKNLNLKDYDEVEYIQP
jgi:hypothetical protein